MSGTHSPSPRFSPVDRLLMSIDHALRTVSGASCASRANPARTLEIDRQDASELSEPERRLAGALMRVNHVGEVCAQALYQAQALTTRSPQLRTQLEHAAQDEVDHLAWTKERLDELGDRISWLTPLWYAGAFTIGAVAGVAGDRVSLGFVVETERQVEQHLDGHLERLPAQDHASRAIVTQMRDDEVRHAREALDSGGVALPAPVRWTMRAAARVMTTVAHRI
ncbi:ubiquinone biosynthesis monooxygenase Coq7 [Sphaerotilus hippei]|uniref:3-demethoxyubiquinol 3-hydroxylase n=1 Tax=Sphaerotilus hippei TaxID=744406 RepID=A0A318H4Z1_9BURK|nr:2-polyprenyl-3-methyl-6-methoxy-1,4-benzoquinone monooxygenase [Sphaerotilus hippei]PXW97116.1 ubiquinone biosynthesis monooxygenase Coq7 [Sphaerotilus hippei]